MSIGSIGAAAPFAPQAAQQTNAPSPQAAPQPIDSDGDRDGSKPGGATTAGGQGQTLNVKA